MYFKWGLKIIALSLTDAFGALVFVIPVGFLTCHDMELAIFCLSAWLGMTGFARSGPVVSIVEVVPRYLCQIHFHYKLLLVPFLQSAYVGRQ